MTDNKHPSPEESENFLTIIRKAPSCQISPYSLKKLLWLINAHPSLIAFFQVCANLAHILNSLEKYANTNLDQYDIEDWPNILRLINRHKKRLAVKLTEETTLIINQENKKHLHAKRTSHGFYCLLCTVHESPQYRNHYDLLIGHLLLAHIQATKTFTTIATYEKHRGPKEILAPYRKVYDSTLALRRLSKNVRLTTMLRIQPYQKTAAFINHLVDLAIASRPKAHSTGHDIDGTIKDTHWKDDHYILLYRTFLINCTVQKRSKSSNKSKGARKTGVISRDSGYLGTHEELDFIEIYESDHDDPMSDWGIQTIVLPKQNGTQQDENATATEPQDTIILSRATCKSKIKDLATYHSAARSAARHIALTNQLLPWTYSIMTVQEADFFVQRFHKLFIKLINKSHRNEKEQLILETVLLAKIIFWTASPLERAVNTKFITNKQNLPCDLAVLLYSDNNTFGEWRIKSWIPSYATAPDEPSETRERKEYVYMQDHVGFTNHLMLYCQTQGVSPSPSFAIFPRPLHEYETELRNLLSNCRQDRRITIYKLTNYLITKIIDRTNNVSIAASITGVKHPLNSARSHYFTPKLNYLRTIHKEIVKEIAPPYTFEHISAAGKTYIRLISTKESHLNLTGISTGSRYCATFQAIRDAIQRLRSDIKSLSHQPDTDATTHHNLFTLYTVLMYGFFTGRRPVHTPLPRTDAVDKETGITILKEKDNQYASKSRVAWVPPMMIEQLNNHQCHCEIITKLAAFSKKNIPLKHTHCFFINENGKPESVRVSSIEQLLEPYIPLPANFHRRFICTNLTEKGCPAEAIDAWMGHWHMGQEPWGKFSSYSFMQYVRQIKEYLLPLLDSLGWRPITRTHQTNA